MTRHNEFMPLFALAFLLLAPQTIELTPTDDVWVYANASDAAHDVNLRIWGAEGRATPKQAGDAEGMSMAYLKWDLASIPQGRKLISAKLILTNIPNPGFTVEQAKAAPLEARPLLADFDEKTWSYENLDKVLPPSDPKSIFGTGAPTAWPKDQPVQIQINLLEGPVPFATALATATTSADHEIKIALTSRLDMASEGRSCIYKIYSRDEKEEILRPRLVLTYE